VENRRETNLLILFQIKKGNFLTDQASCWQVEVRHWRISRSEGGEGNGVHYTTFSVINSNRKRDVSSGAKSQDEVTSAVIYPLASRFSVNSAGSVSSGVSDPVEEWYPWFSEVTADAVSSINIDVFSVISVELENNDLGAVDGSVNSSHSSGVPFIGGFGESVGVVSEGSLDNVVCREVVVDHWSTECNSDQNTQDYDCTHC